MIEHRKFGVGVFVHDLDRDEAAAVEIVKYINKAAKAAEPYFDWVAEQALHRSALNVVNNSASLFARFSFFQKAYREKADEAERRKDEKIVKGVPGKWTSTSWPAPTGRK